MSPRWDWPGDWQQASRQERTSLAAEVIACFLFALLAFLFVLLLTLGPLAQP